MKTAILASVAFVAATMASPLAGGHDQGRGNHRGASRGGRGNWGNSGNSNWNKDAQNPVFTFSKTLEVIGTPDQVVNNVSVATGGLAGSSALFKFGINAVENTICYNITLYGFRGDYLSPAKTATHIHEAVKGKAGPPRLAFPNPVGDDVKRVSYGCLTGPFSTGVLANGTDTGAAFNVQQILDNPAGFFADSHSSLAPAGAMRAQLA